MKDTVTGVRHNPVTEAALDWFMRRQALGDHAASDGFTAWLQADPRHAAAYARVEALWQDPAFVAALTHPASRRRPAWLGTGLRIAASILLLAALGTGGLRIAGVPLHLPADQETAIGTEQEARLDDGTQLVLDTASAADVDYSPTERVVRLREGRAFFTVAADARPFKVVAGSLVIRDIGTAFSVDRRGGVVRVAVRQGEVALTPHGRSTPQQDLRAAQEGGYQDGQMMSPGAIDPQIAFAWLDHRLFFQQRPLGEVVDELRRYHRGWIVIANPALRSLKVSGGYNLDDPVAAIRDLARLSGASLIRISDRFLILR